MKITSASQYKNALGQIERLIKKGFGNLSKKETERLKQTSIVIQAYEMVKFRRNLCFIFLIQLTLIACNTPTSKQFKGDPVIAVESEDSSMNRAIRHARETLLNFKNALTSDTGAKQFSLKLKYPTPIGHEHIWISQIKIINGQMKGIIDNSPNDIPSLKLGDTISVNEEGISDWMFIKSDSIYGGFTIRVLRDRMNETERAKLNRSLGYPFAPEKLSSNFTELPNYQFLHNISSH